MTHSNSRPSRRSVLTGALIAGLACASCAPPDTVQEYQVSLKIQGDPGKPVAGAEVTHGARNIGASDAQGAVNLRAQATEGQVLVVQIRCPEGYRSPPDPLSIVLRRISERDRAPEYSARCEPLLRALVIAVRAEQGPDLPVLYLGRQVARTDRSGAAHFLLQSPPENNVELTLDTSAAPSLRPQSPSARFVVATEDDVLVFSQQFQLPPPKARAVPRARTIIRLGAR